MTRAQLKVLEVVQGYGEAETAQRTDQEQGWVNGRAAHALIRAGLLYVTQSHPTFVVVALTELGHEWMEAPE